MIYLFRINALVIYYLMNICKLLIKTLYNINKEKQPIE